MKKKSASSRRTPRPSEIKWQFVQNESGNVSLFKSNGPLKREDKVLGDVINVYTSKTDEKDEKLKVCWTH